MKNGCQCKRCIDACWNSPGWFGSIEEIKGAAKIMNLNVEVFARKFLIQEWWSSWNNGNNILIPAPRRNFGRISEEEKKFQEEAKEKFPYIMESKERERCLNGSGFVVASWGHNLLSGYACIFLTDNNLCMIHESKPAECRETMVCKDKHLEREDIVPYWAKRQIWFQYMIRKIESKNL